MSPRSIAWLIGDLGLVRELHELPAMRILAVVVVLGAVGVVPGAGAQEARSDAPPAAKFRAESFETQGNAMIDIEWQARKAVRNLTPQKAAEFQVTPRFASGGRTALGDMSMALRRDVTGKAGERPERAPQTPIRLGDYGNDIGKFMEAVKVRTDTFTRENWGFNWYYLDSAKVERPIMKTRTQRLKTRFRAAKRKLMRSSTTPRPRAAKPPTAAKPRVPARAKR